MRNASVIRIAAAVALMCLVASCKGTETYQAAGQPGRGLVIVKDPQKADAPRAAGTEDKHKTDAVEPKETPKDAGKPQPTAGTAGVAEREAVAELYMRAQKHFYDGDPWTAKELLAKVRKGRPYYETCRRFAKLVDDDIAASAVKAKIENEERDCLDRKVHALFRKAEKAFNDKRYADAVKIINEAYRLDPNNTKVRGLRADALIEKAKQDMADNSLNQDARIAEAMSTVERVGTVPHERPRVPKPVFDDKPGPSAEEALALENKLNQRISVNLYETSLDYLLNILFRATGVNIIAKPGDLEGKSITVQAEDIKLIDLLNYVSRTLGVSFTRSGNAIWLQGGADQSTGPMMHTRVIPLKTGLIDVSSDGPSETSDIEKMLDKVKEAAIIDWPEGSEWYLDRMTNTLFVRTTSEAMKELLPLIEAMDVTPPQILIEAKFLEIATKAFSDLGIEWHTTSDFALAKKDGSNKLQIDAGMGVSLPPPVTAGSDFPETAGFDAILAGVMTVPQFQLTLHALKATGHTSSLGEPRLIAVNNASAEMEITRDLYYVSDYEIDRQDWNGSSFVTSVEGDGISLPGTGETSPEYDFAQPIIVPEYDMESVGFKLKVTPSVGRDLKDITLYLEPEITEVVDTLKTRIAMGSDVSEELNVERPIISKRTLKAKVTVSDGYVVVLGGLVRQTKEKGQIKVPLLGDLPLLGQFFRRETEKNVKTNLLIFVSAKIITPEGRMYVGAGPGTLNLGGPTDEARGLRDRIEVEAH